MNFTTADLFDAHPHCTSCVTQFVQFGGLRSFCGQIRTVRARADNALLRGLLETASSGEVVVIDADGYLGAAMLGDNLASIALGNGWGGIILYGAVRDSVALAKLPLGIKALGVNPRKSAKLGRGEVGVPVAFGDAIFRPGEWVYSDEDGLLLSPQRLLE